MYISLNFGIHLHKNKESILPLHVLRGMTYSTDRPKALTLFLQMNSNISFHFVVVYSDSITSLNSVF